MTRPESLHPLEATNVPETPNVRDVYGRLFPGNFYDFLPLLNPVNVVFYELLPERWMDHFILRKSRLRWAERDHEDFAERESIRIFDRATMRIVLGGCSPISANIHGAFFNEHSFEDLVRTDKGERLGGAAVRRISRLEKPEIVIGVLGKEGNPKALIHFLEGSQPRSPKPRKRLFGSLFP